MPDADEEVIDFGKKKKKKSKKKEGAASTEKQFDADFEKGVQYPYEELLQRVHDLIADRNPTLGAGEASKFKMVPPQVIRVGSKKVGWANAKKSCEIMNRPMEHIFEFFRAEFGTEGSITGDGQMILKGRFNAKHIESLLKKYIVEYVTCNMCKSPDTVLIKDQSTRLSSISCNACGASRTVQNIKHGYHATTKAERRAAKNAAIR
jgi:translation initiation factor 2 subunit 2